jgi:hypothetical protein
MFPAACFGHLEEEIFCPCWEVNRESLVVQLVAQSRHRLRYRGCSVWWGMRIWKLFVVRVFPAFYYLRPPLGLDVVLVMLSWNTGRLSLFSLSSHPPRERPNFTPQKIKICKLVFCTCCQQASGIQYAVLISSGMKFGFIKGDFCLHTPILGSNRTIYCLCFTKTCLDFCFHVWRSGRRFCSQLLVVVITNS